MTATGALSFFRELGEMSSNAVMFTDGLSNQPD